MWLKLAYIVTVELQITDFHLTDSVFTSAVAQQAMQALVLL